MMISRASTSECLAHDGRIAEIGQPQANAPPRRTRLPGERTSDDSSDEERAALRYCENQTACPGYDTDQGQSGQRGGEAEQNDGKNKGGGEDCRQGVADAPRLSSADQTSDERAENYHAPPRTWEPARTNAGRRAHQPDVIAD
jgi:hypothetical protein